MPQHTSMPLEAGQEIPAWDGWPLGPRKGETGHRSFSTQDRATGHRWGVLSVPWKTLGPGLQAWENSVAAASPWRASVGQVLPCCSAWHAMAADQLQGLPGRRTLAEAGTLAGPGINHSGTVEWARGVAMDHEAEQQVKLVLGKKKKLWHASI